MFTGPESLVKLLIENGADVNAFNIYNKTALLLSIISGKSFFSCTFVMN